MSSRFLTQEIDDPIIRENFRRLERLLDKEGQLDGFVHIDVTVNSAVESYRVYHGLGYVPLDVIRSRLTGTGDLVLNYNEFDDKTLSMTTTGPLRLRAFVGTYKNSGAKNEPE